MKPDVVVGEEEGEDQIANDEKPVKKAALHQSLSQSKKTELKSKKQKQKAVEKSNE